MRGGGRRLEKTRAKSNPHSARNRPMFAGGDARRLKMNLARQKSF